ncbi:hypothetical protein SDC9_144975 [bioreactor metagenome]|uniref:Uncharacterized protein n=1 Tax=bioreactor metagenome TaxID=1076179 RepID=A0A645E863_9ZZZZ
MIFSPIVTGLKIDTVPFSSEVYSTITTESAPSGIGAPVAISTASPVETMNFASDPAEIFPRSLSFTGSVSLLAYVSSALTA